MTQSGEKEKNTKNPLRKFLLACIILLLLLLALFFILSIRETASNTEQYKSNSQFPATFNDLNNKCDLNYSALNTCNCGGELRYDPNRPAEKRYCVSCGKHF